MLIFCIKDPEGAYTPEQIAQILEKAEKQGHPVEVDSYLAQLTVKQVARLTNGVYDA
jgi:imidazolonepropionase-like amidohydrolase